jgi:hypothetical protein
MLPKENITYAHTWPHPHGIEMQRMGDHFKKLYGELYYRYTSIRQDYQGIDQEAEYLSALLTAYKERRGKNVCTPTNSPTHTHIPRPSFPFPLVSWHLHS